MEQKASTFDLFGGQTLPTPMRNYAILIDGGFAKRKLGTAIAPAKAALSTGSTITTLHPCYLRTPSR